MAIDRRELVVGLIGAVGLSGVGAIAIGLQGGDSGTSGGTSDGGDGTGLPGAEWQTESTDRGSVTVDSDTSLDFRVYRCNTAVATRDLGTVSGTVRVSFDWTFAPDRWWESPVTELVVGGETVQLEADPGIEKERGTETSGRYEGTATVDGATTLRIGLQPSQHCSNPDHEHTRFEVRNLSVST